MTHLVNSVKFDVNCPSTGLAKQIHDKIFSICRHNLSPALDRSIVDGDLTKRLHSITIDLGEIPYSSLDSQLIPKIIAAFEIQLAQLSKEKDPKNEINLLEMVKLFLEKGVMHWAVRAPFNLDSKTEELLKNKWRPFLRFLSSSHQQRVVSSRLAEGLQQKTLQNLIKKLQPTEAVFIIDFLKDMEDVRPHLNQRLIASGNIDLAVKTLVILDLIKNYDTLFNRKMFLKRQLLQLSAAFRLDYLELLNYFNTLIGQSAIPFQFRSSLPAIILELIKETIVLPTSLQHEKTEHEPWHLLLKESISAEEQEKIKIEWATWHSNYTGELRKSLMQEVKTVKHVSFLTERLTAIQVQELVQLLATSDQYFIGHINKQVFTDSTSLHADQIRTKEWEQLIHSNTLSFLLLEQGTTFNRKKYLRYFTSQLARTTQLTTTKLLEYFSVSISKGSDTLSRETLKLVKTLQKEQSTVTSRDENEWISESDAFLLLKQYLVSGVISWIHAGKKDFKSHISSFQKIIATPIYEQQLLTYIRSKQEEITHLITTFSPSLFESIIELFFRNQAKLSKTQIDQLWQSFEEKDRSVANRQHFRSNIFKEVLSFKKLTRADLTKYRIEKDRGSGSLVFQYFKAVIEVTAQSTKELQQMDAPKTLDEKSSLKTWLLQNGSNKEAPSREALENLHELVGNLLASQIDRKRLLLLIDKKQFFQLLTLLNTSTELKLLEALAESSENIELTRQIWSEAPKTKQTKELLLDLFEYSKSGAILSLQKVSTLLKKHRVSESLILHIVSRIKTTKEEVAVEDDPFLVLKDFLNVGHLPEDWTIDQLQYYILLWFRSGHRPFATIIKDHHYSTAQIESWTAHFSDNVLMRLLQLSIGSQLSNFMSISIKIEALLDQALPSKYEAALQNESHWLRRLQYAQRFGSSPISFEHLVRFYLRAISGDSPSSHELLLGDFYLGLIKVRPEINPPSLAKQVDRILVLIKESDPDEGPEEPEQNSDHEETLAEDSIYKVDNAGLILLWPYFKRLFQELGYLNEEGDFESEGTRSKAIRLLQFAVTEDAQEPEYNLVLNKLLCGGRLSQHLPKSEGFKEEELSLTNSMIKGAIANWEKLGNTSVEGFRNSFLIREGSLAEDGKDWVLQVEKKGIDVLLDSLPWGISNVKLPWMDHILYVSWR